MWKLLVCAAFASVVPAATVLGQGPVHFADAALKAAVEYALGITDPNASDMLPLDYWSCSKWGVESLVGIEYAPNTIELTPTPKVHTVEKNAINCCISWS